MQLTNVLKWLILVVPIVSIISCSLHPSKKHDGTSTMVSTNNISMDMNSNNSSTNELDSSQLNELQYNNIVYFDLDQYQIHSEFEQMLNAHAKFLRNNQSNKVIIEGHTDERGTPEYNIALGERRANAVKMYLQGKGVSVEQITIVSYGKEKPALLGHNELTYAKNRRAVLVY